jgi:hypothetical protein
VAACAATDDDFGMKSLATSVLWFFAVWVAYDMAAFATGMPRVVTPLVALLVATGIGLALRVRSADGSVANSDRPGSEIEGIVTS